MWTAALIKNHIAKIEDDKPFSTRDFLSYGSRPAVDQALWRLVNAGLIIRVARGLFIKKDSPIPTIIEVAQAKAAAFGRTIVTHGSEAAKSLGLNCNKKNEIAYATNGRTSSFRFGKLVIKLIGTSPRKLGLQDDPIGSIIRALWYHGKANCTKATIMQATMTLNRPQKTELRKLASVMPWWMQQCFYFQPKTERPAKRTHKSPQSPYW